MSPFIFDADLHAVSAHVRDIRSGLLAGQVDASWEEERGDESAELTLRVLAAGRAGDASALALIFERAEEIDAGQPFGPRLVDQLAALVSGTAAA